MIRFERITKRFGVTTVLDGVDLTIAAGRVTAILGPNGAGKSTLIKMLLGLARPTRGTISVGGRVVTDDPECRREIGYVPQTARMPENLSARDLLAMLSALRGEPAGDDTALIARLGLSGELDKPVRTLSGGTRQKVSALLALRARPQILVLDEPTAGLDPLSSSTLKEIIREQRTAHRTILVTSHVLSELEDIAEDVVFLTQGRIVFNGSRLELVARTREASLERGIAALMRAAAEAAA